MPVYQLRSSRVSAVQFIDGEALPAGVEACTGGGFATASGARVAFGDYVLSDGRVMSAESFERDYEPVPVQTHNPIYDKPVTVDELSRQLDRPAKARK